MLSCICKTWYKSDFNLQLQIMVLVRLQLEIMDYGIYIEIMDYGIYIEIMDLHLELMILAAGESWSQIMEKNTTRTERELDSELLKKMETMQKRIEALEEWQRQVLSQGKDDTGHQRDDRINSLSEQIAILEERLEECSCNKRDTINFPAAQQ
ncbi:epidermal growth factor-like protein 8 [Nephila pilipes]|uniref:Epidermal growth factor-like protein 8 n=1 Tax=Nephila pilipes TaxID=299642 RepID=A0A8X6UN25_NEPPI|nr:epidermal growth factor-like protein 8 [Nephila pilipes]